MNGDHVHRTSGGDLIPFCVHGGLTIVALTGFEEAAQTVADLIKQTGDRGPKHRHTPCDVVVPEFGYFPQGEPEVTLGKDHIGDHDCVILTSGPGTPEMLLRLQLAVYYLAGRKARRIIIVSGYFPTGRSDKDKGSKQFALPPMVVKTLMGVAQNKLKRIVCADPHSDQVVMAADPGMITPVYLTRMILQRVVLDAQKLSDKICLAFPDDSACKRYEPAIAAVEKAVGAKLPVVTTFQRRTSGTEKTPKYTVGDTDALRDAIVITLDDETATGGSQINAANIYKDDFGAARVWAAVTHGILCGDAPQLFAADDCPVERLYVTDTVPIMSRPELGSLRDSGKLEVISWLREVAWIIYRTHWGLDVRDLRRSLNG